MRSLLKLNWIAWLLLLIVVPLNARVVRVEVTSRSAVLNGKTFGDAGAYERITGRVYFSLPIANPHNQRVVDLGNAVNLKNGEVEFSSDFIAVRPKDAQKGNGSILLEVPNRGRGRMIGLVDGGDWDLAHDSGDGWLLCNGFTVVTLGWQWDATGANALGLFAPVAKDNDNGKAITGLLRGDLMPWQAMPEIPLGHLILGNIGGSEYPVAVPDDPRNVLTVRDSRDAPRSIIPRSQWQFAHMDDGKLSASDRHIHLNGGFQSGKIYEYVYVVADPIVAGGGFAVIRDFASYTKHNADAITPATRVYGEGISQNGRFLRDFLYQGFNADEEGRIALDGVLAHVAGAGRGSFNYRSHNRRATHNPPLRSSFPPTSSLLPTSLKKIRWPQRRLGNLPERRLQDCSTAPAPRKLCPGFSSPTLLMNIGVARPRSFTPALTENRMRPSQIVSAFITSPACNTTPARFLQRKIKEISWDKSRNLRSL
jgi:hypothetical protein